MPNGHGSSPELLGMKFARMLIGGEFVDLGLTADNTRVKIMNTSKLVHSGKDVPSQMLQLVKESKTEGKDIILFVKDFSVFNTKVTEKTRRESLDYSMNTMFNSGLFRNIHVVGLVSKEVYNDWLDFSKPNNIRENREWMNHFKKIELISPGSQETAKLFKDKTFRTKALSEKARGVDFSPKSIDRAAEITGMCAGEFPQKLVDFLDLAVANKILRTEKEVSKINIRDVEDVFKTHPNFREIAQSNLKTFEVIDKPKTRLADVGGIDEIKDKIQVELLEYMKNPAKYKKQGAKIPKGVLLYGPPGTGKTLLARAIAGEAEVPFISTSASQFDEKYVGVGAARVRELFSLAETQAQKSEKKTAIIFIDEFDSVAQKREEAGMTGRDQTLNQLLERMDGMSTNEDTTIIVLAATNRLDSLDAAAIRPGRFDRHFEVPNPDKNLKARREILEIHAKDKVFESDEEKKRILNIMASETEGMSGADIKGIMDDAAMKTCYPGREIPHITLDDLKETRRELLKSNPDKKVKRVAGFFTI